MGNGFLAKAISSKTLGSLFTTAEILMSLSYHLCNKFKNSLSPQVYCRLMLPQVWTTDQQLQHHLRACSKCKFSGPIPDPNESDNLGIRPSKLF